ncbi:thioesterase family protein [Microbacterium sp. A94]|uniref:thioesterase family protein n=1 Tax=Microbacterium sp. A94 TaxID=3450717 RepID=UPI003F42C59B
MSHTPVPTYEQLNALPIWESLIVQDSQIDDRDHMNIRFYFDAAARAILGMCERLGLDDHYRSSAGADVFTAEHHIRYFAELRLADTYSTRVRVGATTGKALNMTAYLLDESHGRLACAFDATLINVDLTTRRAVEFSPIAAQRLASWSA